MYFQECERLASDHQELSGLIAKVDSLLRGLPPHCTLRAEIFAKSLHEKHSRVDGLFQKLEEYGLLRGEEMVECPKCENIMPSEHYEAALNDEDEYLCTQCGIDLTTRDCSKTKVYRLCASATVSRAADDDVGTAHNQMRQTSVRQELPISMKKDAFCDTPLLRYYSRSSSLKAARPFAGKRTLVILHFLKDLLPFMEAAFALGLEPKNATVFFKSYPYPQREVIAEWLTSRGCRVFPVSQIHACLDELSQAPPRRTGSILIIEDGGHLAPTIHRSFPLLRRRVIGAVEQTTRGIMNTKEWLAEDGANKLGFPILSVAGSKLKAEFEPPYIAKAVVNNIGRMLPHMAWNGKQVGLMGFGTIGQELASWLVKNGANVTVYEPCSDKSLLAHQRGDIRSASSAAEAASGKDFVIGASGKQSIDALVMPRLKHDAYLVSASSEQYEIDQEELSRLAEKEEPMIGENGSVIGMDFVLSPDKRRIHLLANGYPINFWGMESMPEEASDLIMTLILLASVEAATGKHTKPKIDESAVNELADDKHYAVANKFLQIHHRP